MAADEHFHFPGAWSLRFDYPSPFQVVMPAQTELSSVESQMYSNINNASSAASDPSNCACFADYCPSTSPLLPAAIRPADPLSWDQAPLKINRPRPA
jgi:hypothetical protein